MFAVHFNIVNVDDFCVLVLDEVEQGPRLARAVVGVPSKAMVMTHDLNLFTLVMLLIMVIMDDGDVHDEGDEGDDGDDSDEGDDDYVIPSQLQFQSMVLDQLVKKVDIRLNVCYDVDTTYGEDCVRCNSTDHTENLRKTPKQVVVELQDIKTETETYCRSL